MFAVFFFKTEKDRVPVREFLDNLPDPRAKAQIIRAIQRLGEVGFLPEPFSRAIAGSRKLRELRITHGGNIYRVFYSLVPGGRILLLHGFVKKTGKTPPNEIRVAEARLKQYLEGEHEEKN